MHCLIGSKPSLSHNWDRSRQTLHSPWSPACATRADFNPCLAGRMLQLKQARNGRSLRAAASTEEKADSPATPASKATTDADPKKAEIDQLMERHREGYELTGRSLNFKPPSAVQKFWTTWKLLRARPWRRFQKGSVLIMKLGGEIGDTPAGLFNENYSLRQLCQSISNAALDPRVAGIFVKISPLAVGWAKVQELRRYISFFRQSGKFAISYMYTGGEKEYFLASAFSEFYCAPSASFTLRGLAVSGSFVKGVFEKVGIEPQVRRLGKYKSAGDQLSRKDMSEPQREQLTALLDDIFDTFKQSVAASVGKSSDQVQDMLDAGFVDVAEYAEQGWLTGLKYEDEIITDLEKRTDSKPGELKSVSMKKYHKVSPTTFTGPTIKKRVAVIRASGTITGTEAEGPASAGITAQQVIKQLHKVREDKNIAAVVLRVDSPGGEATASDLMWREIRQLAEKKPVVASMGDVAASGGFYMAMGAGVIVAEPLTITGSIGVVTAKFNLQELYTRIGFSKEVISRGRFAEILGESRGFTAEEEALFDRAAQRAYEDFRNKAAESRGMTPEAMQEHAQGRVWTGRRAISIGLVDYLGGLSSAVMIAKQMAGISQDERVRVTELLTSRDSPLALLRGAVKMALSSMEGVKMLAASGSLLSSDKAAPQLIGEVVIAAAAARSGTLGRRPLHSTMLALMSDIQVIGASEL